MGLNSDLQTHVYLCMPYEQCVCIPSVHEGHKKNVWGRGQLKCDGTRAETRFRLSAKRTSLFKSAGLSVQSTTGNGGVRISGSNAGYAMFRGSAKSTGYPHHSPVSPSLRLPCVTVCHHISTGLYNMHPCLPTSLSHFQTSERFERNLVFEFYAKLFLREICFYFSISNKSFDLHIVQI
jgi:hypothetical protein